VTVSASVGLLPEPAAQDAGHPISDTMLRFTKGRAGALNGVTAFGI
jgi:hypothetical protein